MQYLTNFYKNLSEQLQEKVNFLEKLLNETNSNSPMLVLDDGNPVSTPSPNNSVKNKNLISKLGRGVVGEIGAYVGDIAADAITSTPYWDEKMKKVDTNVQDAMKGMSPSQQDALITGLDVAYHVVDLLKNPYTKTYATISDKLDSLASEGLDKIKKTAPATQEEIKKAAAEAKERRAKKGIQTYD